MSKIIDGQDIKVYDTPEGVIDLDWLEVTIESTPACVDLTAAELLTLGFTGLEIEDESDLTELLAQHKRNWDYIDDELRKTMRGVCRIKLYVSDDEAGMTRLDGVKECLKRVREMAGDAAGTLEINLRALKESDWAEEWKRWYKPLYIGQRVLIRPEWETVPETGERVVFVNDPGMSFGTGEHESTRMCIEALDKLVKSGETVLDLGSGSGILFIIALLLGAGEATAVDIEPNAVKTAERNADINQIVPERYRVFSGDIIEDSALQKLVSDRKYDIITANIVADVIIAAAPYALTVLNSGGVFITSGIITERCEEVIQALNKAGFTLIERTEQNGWCCLVLTV